MGASIKQDIVFQNRIKYCIISPKLYALCIVKFWKNSKPPHNTNILHVFGWETFKKFHGSN